MKKNWLTQNLFRIALKSTSSEIEPKQNPDLFFVFVEQKTKVFNHHLFWKLTKVKRFKNFKSLNFRQFSKTCKPLPLF